MTVKKWILIAISIVLIVVAVMGLHWTDVAETPFWWNFWPWASGISVLGFVIIVVYVWSSSKKREP